MLVATLNAELLECWAGAKMRCTNVAPLASPAVRVVENLLREETTIF